MSRFFTRPDLHVQYGEYQLPRVEHCDVGLCCAPDDWDGVTALFLSDVHLGRFAGTEFTDRLIDMVRGLDAQLLLLGGDFAENGDMMRHFFARLGELYFPLGKFAVKGNNDVQCAMREALDLREIMAQAGVQLLVNERAEVRLPGGRLIIGGVDECFLGHPDARELFADACDIDARILLSHYPIMSRREFFGVQRPELMLCGHTHGGQVNILGITPYTIGYEKEFGAPDHMKGWRGKTLVSAGIGCSKVALRIGARPAMHMIKIAKNRRNAD